MRRLGYPFLILMLTVLPCAFARAVPQPQQIPALPAIVTTYDIYVGGIHLVTADILFQEQTKKYHTWVKAHTYGFWQKALPWNTLLETDGRIVKDQFLPQEFYTRDVWKTKPKVTKLHFDAKGNVAPEFDPPSHEEGREVVTLDQRRGSLDPVTALLQMMAHAAIQKNCAVTVSVFDGKRLFDITGSEGGAEDIDEEDYGVYKGPARVCNADFKMIAGEWQDRKPARFWQKNDKEMGRDPFHIWLAPVSPDLPEMPVRLETGSVFGLIMIHLSSWRYATSADFKP